MCPHTKEKECFNDISGRCLEHVKGGYPHQCPVWEKIQWWLNSPKSTQKIGENHD